MNKKEERKHQNKILLLLLLLLFTCLLFSTTSYAWFSANRMVTIDSLNIKVNTVGGIEISADALNWKNTIETDELIDVKETTYTTNKNQIPLYLEPVSTGGEIDSNTGFLKMYHGVATNDDYGTGFILTTTRNIENFGYGVLTDGKFIAFDIFLKTQAPRTLYLTTDSGISFNGDTSVGLENAFRIAFLYEGTLPIETNYTNTQNLKGASEALIWEPNYDTHTSAGQQNALETYGVNVSENGSAKVPYDGVIDEITRSDNVYLENATASNFSTKFKRVNVNYYTPTVRESYEQVFDLPGGVSKVRVYVWVEGQDVDCENNASVGDVNLNLRLSTNPA